MVILVAIDIFTMKMSIIKVIREISFSVQLSIIVQGLILK